MNHVQSSDTHHHYHMESLQPELLRNCPSARHRPPHRCRFGIIRQALGRPGPAAVGLRPLAGHSAAVHCAQASQARPAGGGGGPGAGVAGGHGLLPREAPPRRSGTGWPSPRRPFTAICNEQDSFGPAPIGDAASGGSGGGPASRTGGSCGPVTALAWGISNWT